MAWIQRGPHLYYSRYTREGQVVRRVNFGKGPVADLAASLDELRRLDHQARARVWRDEQARHLAADELLDGFCHVTNLLTEAILAQAGFHRHDRGSWRKRRMSHEDVTTTAEPFTPEEVLAAARRGDRSVLPALRRLRDSHPRLWQDLGDLGAHTERAWVDLVARSRRSL